MNNMAWKGKYFQACLDNTTLQIPGIYKLLQLVMLEITGSMWQRQQFLPSGMEQQRAWSAGVLPLSWICRLHLGSS